MRDGNGNMLYKAATKEGNLISIYGADYEGRADVVRYEYDEDDSLVCKSPYAAWKSGSVYEVELWRII